MCVIIKFKPGQKMPFEELSNACYNNWHSYGLVTVVDNKLDIKRVVPENGEVNPEDVAKALDVDRQYLRYLHLRHNTAGATNLDNCQPFEVFYKGGKKPRHVAFMHNGTMYEYKSKKFDHKGVSVDDDDGPSDSKNFVEQVLIPFLNNMDFGDGKCDIQSPHTHKLLKKFWTYQGNRGLLISSDQGDYRLGDWKKVVFDGDEFDVSNDDYFKEVTRGPEHTRRLLQQEQLRKGALSLVKDDTSDSTNTPFIEIKHLDKHIKKDSQFRLSAPLDKILDDWDFYDRSCYTLLGLATREELSVLMDHPKEAVYVLELALGDYYKLNEEFNELKEKHDQLQDKLDRASRKIAELMKKEKSK